jgi:GT2 family glycosyltransferase
MPATAENFSETAHEVCLEVGVVVIGRNEGERLRRCLNSILPACGSIVYVDSGSADQSVELTRSLNVEVVELDMSIPFTAARARNAGFARLTSLHEKVEFVQFVDGDCELFSNWLNRATAEIKTSGERAIVCGALLERFPERSIYNRICAIEWNGPLGEIATCGGIFLVRAAFFKHVGGFDPTIIAAEDDDFCLRVRSAGGRIFRIDAQMAWHDAAMTRFAQWWKRAVRCGYGFAQISSIHGGGPFRHFVRESRSAWFWGVILPLAIVAIAILTRGWALAALPLAYLVAAFRIVRNNRWRGLSPAIAWVYAGHCLGSKFPQVVGQVKFWWRRARKAPHVIIEHKLIEDGLVADRNAGGESLK